MVAAILSFVVLILVLAFIKSANEGTRNIVDKQICKQSVEANALFRFDKLSAKTDIKCPTIFIKSSATKKAAVFETLALAMADTWDEFLLGRVEIFDTSTQNYCVIRRVVQFDNPEQYEGFFDYLIMHDPPNIRMPYFSYLTGFSFEEGTESFKQNIELKNNDKLNTNTPYATVFVMAKKEHIGRVLGAKYGAIAGASVGVIAGGTIVYLSGGSGIVAVAGTVAKSTTLGTAIGTGTGFLLGSKYPASWDAAMLLVPYNEESLKTLDCTKLPVSITNEEGAVGG
ncbi:MAG: hypothetical protein AABW88_02455 [Nanoarchaeota archaeon]